MSTACRNFSVICFLMFLAAAAPVSAIVGGYPMPSLQDEKNFYGREGWVWSTSDLPNFPAQPTYTVSDPDIHGDTESDNLWMYIMQWRRTGQPGYRDRMIAWARYMKDDYLQCVGTSGRTFCADAGHFHDHTWVNGLVSYYELTGDVAYKTAAENICDLIEDHWLPGGAFGAGVPGSFDMGRSFATRNFARHMLAFARCYEHNTSRWQTIFHRLVDLYVQAPDWVTAGPSGGQINYVNQAATDLVCGSGAFVGGARINATFHLGQLGEAFFHAYRVLPDSQAARRNQIRAKMVAMARFAKDFGLHPTENNSYTYHGVNINTGARVSCQSSEYSTVSLTNILAFGSWFTSGAESTSLYDRAKLHLDHGTKYINLTPAGQVDHFVDTVKESASGGFYMWYNKGELQYTWAIFRAPAPPSSTLKTVSDAMTPDTWAVLNTSGISTSTLMESGGNTGFITGDGEAGCWDRQTQRAHFIGMGHWIEGGITQGPRHVVYDAATNTWIRMTDPPHAFTGLGGAAMHEFGMTACDEAGRAVYLGQYNSGNLWKYNITSGTWTQLPSVPASVKAYLLGAHWSFAWNAHRGAASQAQVQAGQLLASGVESGTDGVLVSYDPATNSWARVVAGLISGIGGVSTTDYNEGSGFTVFGTDGSPSTPRKLSAQGQLSTIATWPACQPRLNRNGIIHADPATGNFVMLCGSGSASWHIYNPVTNTWATKPTPSTVTNHILAVPQVGGTWPTWGKVGIPIWDHGVIMYLAPVGSSYEVRLYKSAYIGNLTPGTGPPVSDTEPPAAPFLRAP